MLRAGGGAHADGCARPAGPRDHLPLARRHRARDHGGELWGSTELLFTFRDNALAGPPTPAKSSGNESVDDALVGYLVELESTFDLRDGYYRFVLDP